MGTGLAIFKYLAINKIIDLDIYGPWDYNTMNNFSLKDKEIIKEREIVGYLKANYLNTLIIDKIS